MWRHNLFLWKPVAFSYYIVYNIIVLLLITLIMQSNKLALIQQLIATEDEYVLNAIWSLLNNGESKISDSLYSELLESQSMILSGKEKVSDWNELQKDLETMIPQWVFA